MKELLLVASIHFLAVASPGPDFALVLKNSLTNNRRAGVYSALGVACGIAVHVMYSILGIALVISRSIMLFNFIKLIGAGYLIWIGIKSIRSKKSTVSSEGTGELGTKLNDFNAFKQGFLTNILNPKVTLFFLSLFTQVIDPSTSSSIKLLYGIEMITATFIWFCLMSIFMTQKPVKSVYAKIRHHIDRLFGVVLIALGLKIAFDAH